MSTATPARATCTAVGAAAQFAAAASSNRNLALVSLTGSFDYVVRDITDIDHSFTVSCLGGLAPISGPNAAYSAKFVSASDISYSNDNGQLLRKAFDGSPTKVANSSNGLFGFVWSPDGGTAAYLTATTDYSAGQLHLVRNGQDRMVASTSAFAPTGCESPVGCERVSSRLLYSPDGRYLSFVNSWPGPPFRVWTSEGTLLASKDSGFNTASVWSGSTLYFRTDRGIETWRDGKESLLVPGVAWVKPEASQAGSQIVYHVRAGSDAAHIVFLDTTTGRTRELASYRAFPAFLTSRYVWYRGERACTSGDPFPCTSGSTTISNGKTYIYDLRTGTESESNIDAVFDVWPHPA
jgi:hypothetical protein